MKFIFKMKSSWISQFITLKFWCHLLLLWSICISQIRMIVMVFLIQFCCHCWWLWNNQVSFYCNGMINDNSFRWKQIHPSLKLLKWIQIHSNLISNNSVSQFNFKTAVKILVNFSCNPKKTAVKILVKFSFLKRNGSVKNTLRVTHTYSTVIEVHLFCSAVSN